MARAKAEKRASKHVQTRSRKISRVDKRSNRAELKLVSAPPEIKLSTRGKAAAVKQLDDESGEKKLSSRLLETLERHRQKRMAQLAALKPKGRRGRRPKVSLDYVPEHQEEDSYVLEQEYEALQYDTGIPVPSKEGETAGVNVERSEEYDEELNFEW